MTQRCRHCQAENLVGDDAGAAAPMCMRCGQRMEPSADNSLSARGAHAAAVPQQAAGANDFEGSTVIVMRPDLPAKKETSATGASAPLGERATAGAVDEEVWHALIEGTQMGPLTLGALKHHYAGKRLHEKSLLWRAGMATWTPLEHMPEVLAALRAPAAAPSATHAQAAQALMSLVEEEVASRAGNAPAASAGPAPVLPATIVAARPRATSQRRPVALAIAAVAVLMAVGAVWALRRQADVAVAQTTAAPAPSPPAVAPPPPATTQATAASHLDPAGEQVPATASPAPAAAPPPSASPAPATPPSPPKDLNLQQNNEEAERDASLPGHHRPGKRAHHHRRGQRHGDD